jgi:uncharacterized membrane protein YphA (DoxX/SURF4 family)
MTLVVVCSLMLSAVLATAGVAKLRDRAGSRDAIAGFGVPASLTAPLALVVPIAELAAALALIVGPTRTWGALGALVLIAGFSLAITRNLARGRTPECHCFGQLHSSPAGPRALARNAALLTLAGLVASQADPVSTALVAAVGIAIGVAGWALSRRATPAGSNAEAAGLTIGAPAPSFELPSKAGSTVSLRSLLTRGAPTLLLFSDPQCGPCQALAPDVAAWQRLYDEELTIAVVERRNGADADGGDDHGRRTVLLQSATEVSDSYRATGTPSAVLIGTDGRVASPVAGGADAIETLIGANVTNFEPHPTELEGGSAWTVPVRLGGPLIRRELLVRGAGTAAAGTLLARPLRALGLGPRGAPKCKKDKDCPRRTVCRGGRCACPGGHEPDRCRGDCTNYDVDKQHCGGCPGKQCGFDEYCYGGRCIPRSGDGSTCAEDCGSTTRVCCQGRCRGLGFDREHCGGCGISCPPGQTCCWGRCTDPQRDPRFCGGGSDCTEGEKCFPDQVCHAGKCRDKCPEPLRQCGQMCGNPNTQTCCGKNVLIDKEDIENGRLKCCDGEAVAPLPDGRCPRFCQGQPYDPQVYQCCEEGLRPWEDGSFFCP